MQPLVIAPDLTAAERPAAAVYDDDGWWQRLVERVLAPAWHVCPPLLRGADEGAFAPDTLLPGCLDEPLLHVAGGGVLSNVCPGCGATIVDRLGPTPNATPGVIACTTDGCGARYDLRGQDSEAERRLAAPAVGHWGPLTFASLDTDGTFDAGGHGERLRPLPWADAAPQANRSRDYDLRVHWLDYCEHALRNVGGDSLDVDGSTSLRRRTRADETPIPLPPGHADHGCTQLRWWLFPTTFIDIDAEGFRVRAVHPLATRRTRVVSTRWSFGATAAPDTADPFDRVHQHLEAQVERRTRGRRSRLAPAPPYDPAGDVGVHHLHHLLAAQLSEST